MSPSRGAHSLLRTTYPGSMPCCWRVSAGVDVHEKIEYKGTVVLGTVYQDVHSIGKDLAKRNNFV